MKKKAVSVSGVYPEIEGGRYPVKREAGEIFEVLAYISGSRELSVWLKVRQIRPSRTEWHRSPMEPAGEKEWRGSFIPEKPGRYQYTIEVKTSSSRENVLYRKILEAEVEPLKARFAAWYEMFHRSQGKVPGRSATFKDMEERLEDIKKMGFNVIYLPPVHPIGKTKRKGPNNSLTAGPNDPGCPWSIGDETGGHKAVHPDLGTIEDFKHFVRRANEMGFEVALDIALNCSADHPYLKEHPEWFYRRPDGTIAYAENPPKKYEDVYPLNFYPENREAMWEEMKSIFLFWIENGVKMFRIDNPHTKPAEFWEWLINEVKGKYPETVFLSEAFTNYDKLEELARIGFTQSYSYFTWRNTKNELIEYFLKLTSTYLKDFLRVNLFTNTPDICPPIIQTGGRPAFKMRIALAATLSSVYGMYNGYELCESNAFSGTETYRDSEKYQYKVWDWDRPGNIKDYIAILNRIREENPALHYYDNLRFYSSTNEHIIFYGKSSRDKKNIILAVVNLNPYETQNTRVTVPVEEFGIGSDEKYTVRELITDRIYVWQGRENYIRLDPHIEPAYLFRIERHVSREGAYKKQESVHLAETHGRHFFSLREAIIKRRDLEARRELEELYIREIIPRVYTGPVYDEDYARRMNEISRENGYPTIIKAHTTTPGH